MAFWNCQDENNNGKSERLGTTLVKFLNHGQYDKQFTLSLTKSEQRKLCERLGVEYKEPKDGVLTVLCDYKDKFCTILGVEVDKTLFKNVLNDIHEYKRRPTS